MPDQHIGEEPTHSITLSPIPCILLFEAFFILFPCFISSLWLSKRPLSGDFSSLMFRPVWITSHHQRFKLVVSAERRRLRLSGSGGRGRRLSSQPAQRGLAPGHLVTRPSGGGARRGSDAHQRLHHWAGHQLGPVRCVATDAASWPAFGLVGLHSEPDCLVYFFTL